MEKIDTLVVDKTGTLTEGKPKARRRRRRRQASTKATLLQLAASVERASEHPLAAAIVAAAAERKIELLAVTGFDCAGRQRRRRHGRGPARRARQCRIS